MGALTVETPKPLLHLQGRPILEHVLLGLRDAGVSDAVLVTGYRGDQIEQYFGNGDRLGLRLHYCRQTEQNGTAKALLLTRSIIDDRPFVMSWGDIVIEPHHYRGLVDSFSRQTCDALLSVNPVDDPWAGAAVYVDEQWRITRLVEKPPRGTSTTGWNNAGVFMLAPIVFDYAARLTPSSRGEYELPQALAAMVADGRSVRAYPLSGFWSDLGTPDDLAAAERTYPGRRD